MSVPNEILELDKSDILGVKCGEFLLPVDTIYMDGNSLGPLTTAAEKRISNVVSEQWGNDLIHSWNAHDWIGLALTVGDKIAPLIGAKKGQVIACDSTSINLFKVLSSALGLNSSRHVVVSLSDNFPTDLYMAQGLSDLLGQTRCELKSVQADQLLSCLDDTVAVLMLTQVNFRTGQLYDMRKITHYAQKKGIVVVWDLAHSAGALDVHLDDCNVDFAVGCGYKYFNGGPGASAFIYAAHRHHRVMTQPLSGWMGHKSPFNFEHDYKADESMKMFLTGTPNILSLSALDAALDVFSGINIKDIRTKSLRLSQLFIESIDNSPSLNAFKLESPREPESRGSQLAYSHDSAFAISQALIESKVIVDFRAPNIIRFGFTPLYLSYQDVWQAAQAVIHIVGSSVYDNPQYLVRSKVT